MSNQNSINNRMDKEKSKTSNLIIKNTMINLKIEHNLIIKAKAIPYKNRENKAQDFH